MDRSLIDMLLSMSLSFALGLIVYEAVFAYSFKRRRNFVKRAIVACLGVGAIATGMAFAMYGMLAGKTLDPSVIWQVDLTRAVAFLIFVALGIFALLFCFDEKPTLILFSAVAANAALTISTTLYALWCDIFGLTSIYFSMYSGYDTWSFVAFYLTHAFVLVSVWLLFARPFAKTQKNFEKYINKFNLGIYVMYAFFTAAISGSQFFNMSLMGIDSFVIPLIFNGFSLFFAVFVLFVQRFNLFWVKDLQEQEAASNFHKHYKDRVEKQQFGMQLINRKVDELKDQITDILSKQNIDSEVLDELQSAISIFDSGIQTGNDALDVLLTQKSLALSLKNVQTSVVIEGEALSFMDVADINAFFGNAIDNAMEYLDTVDEDKRFLRISSTRNRSLLMVRIENYCNADLTFGSDGRPHSTKGDSNGYGTNSIKSVALKYGGTASFAREGDLFVVTALFSASKAF